MRQHVIAILVISSACALPLWAHAPDVEPYKKASSVAVAAVLGILTVALLRQLSARWMRVLIGVAVFLLVWFAGMVVSCMSSL